MINDQIQHGSYHKYYEFRSQDSRPQHLEQSLQQCLGRLGCHGSSSIHMLDIGCNSGKLTDSVVAVVQTVLGHSKRVSAIGVDIDGELIKEACSTYRKERLEFAQADVGAIGCGEVSENPVKNYMQRHEIQQFDFVFCFSVLMYIHLNRGDAGLRNVLDYICSKAKVLVLELQSWKKYSDHNRRMKREAGGIYQQFGALEWRGNKGRLEQIIRDYVISRGFDVVSDEREKNEFNRNIVIFSKSIAEQ